MKIILKLSAIFICLVTLLVSCAAPKQPEAPEETDEITQKVEITDTKKPDPEPEGEAQLGYTQITEPGKLKGDIQPIYNIMSSDICGLGLSIASYNDVYRLVDFNGEVKGELNSADYSFCSVCDGITDHACIVDPETYIPEEYTGGHGGPLNTPYIYDTETGDVYEELIGGYEKHEDKSGAIVVQLCSKRPITEEETESFSYNTDFVFESATCYGLLIDGELVQSNFEMYSRYSNGIVALCREGKWGYYNTEGEEVFPCEYSPSTQQLYNALYEPVAVPYQASYGVIALCRFGKWGYADTEGNMLTDFVFEEARPVYKNRGWVKTEEGWCVIELDYEHTEISEEEMGHILAGYAPEDGGIISVMDNVTWYDTECKAYLVNGEYTLYVTTDGKVLGAIYE
ncbi:MAG: WG repeat-containing protein [Clostridia bacterium]|nr:WG repeat-containing protein [Clostridia bacterium]